MLSGGLVDEARKKARRNVDLLYPLVERGVPLVGLEPSCILTIRDDYAKLLPNDERVRKLAGATRLFEEALLELDPEHLCIEVPVLLPRPLPPALVVRARRSERSPWRPAPTSGWSTRVAAGWPGSSATRRAIRGLDEDGGEAALPGGAGVEGRVVVAPGTSCREQILDGTGRRALHPAEYLAALLDGAA